MVRIDGRQVRTLREEKGLTQLYLATAVGVTTDTISRWENRHYQSVKLDNARRLAEALEVELGAILDEETVPAQEQGPAAPEHPPASSRQDMHRIKLKVGLLLVALAALALVVALLIGRKPQQQADIGLKAFRKTGTHAMPGYPFPVVITVESSGAPVSVVIRELLPAHVKVVTSSATLQPQGKAELKWIVKHFSGRQRFGYMVTVSGFDPLTFDGTVTTRAGLRQEVMIGGRQALAMAPFHWADSNQDNVISDDEILVVYDDFEDVPGLDVDVELVEDMWMGRGYRWDSDQKGFVVIPWD